MIPVSYSQSWENYVHAIETSGRICKALCRGEYAVRSVFMDVTLLWDTGAVMTMISTRLVNSLGLCPTGRNRSINTHGENELYTYEVDLLLPNKIKISGLTVIADLLPDTDVLIGMDVINLCDFAITHPSRHTRFSIQTPSVADIQF